MLFTSLICVEFPGVENMIKKLAIPLIKLLAIPLGCQRTTTKWLVIGYQQTAAKWLLMPNEFALICI